MGLPIHNLNSVANVALSSDFFSLGEAFYASLLPQGITEPEWVAVSGACAGLLGLSKADILNLDLAYLSGNGDYSSNHPLAMVYSGHQFGTYNPQLGDGRGILLGEIETENHQLWDLHLKGAGVTPFSRTGDGRAVLRSSIREFLASEALFHLGIPTTRALSLVVGKDQILRERVEPSAMLCRVTQSHIRFGSFEYFYYNQQFDQLKQLLDYTLLRYFPLLQPESDGHLAFFEQVCQRTASMVAKWQAVGFCHGVMNTDNMSILGETFDFGPFGFMESYNPGFISNHSDYQGRYAFNQQPNMAYWNCSCLAQALSPFIDQTAMTSILDRFPMYFWRAFVAEMQEKLGFASVSCLEEDFEQDKKLIESLIKCLEVTQLDYTNFFRCLSQSDPTQVLALLNKESNGYEALSKWLEEYIGALESKGVCFDTRAREAKAKNPKYILRNYMAHNAIVTAESGDYQEVNRLLELLSKPFDEQESNQTYAQDSPDWGCALKVSCSS